MQPTPPSALAVQLPATEEGLTTEEAQQRLATIGPNEPTPVRRGALARQLLLFLANPLVLILLIASVVAGVLGEVINAIIIAVIVLLSVALNHRDAP